MQAKGKIGLVGVGAAGAALAVEMWLRGRTDIILFDADPAVREAFVRAGGIAYDGLFGQGVAGGMLFADSLAEIVSRVECLIVTVTAGRHVDLGREMAPLIGSDQLVVLHTGYVGGCRVFYSALRSGGCTAPPHLAEAINTLHLAAARKPCDVFIRGRKRWLEVTGLTPEATRRALDLLTGTFPEIAAGRVTLETGLNNPNPIGHVPALVGNLGLLDRNLGAMSQGTLQFDELRSGSVQLLGDAFEQERIAVMKAIGLRPIPLANFIQRAYGPDDRLTPPLPRFGTKLLPRFFEEDVAAACVPIESLGAWCGTPTPVISALVEICAAVADTNFRTVGRTVATLGADWVESECSAVRT